MRLELADRFHGIPVTLSESMTISGPPKERRYTWRQRLLSWPWRPWRATYWVTPQIPNPDVYRVGDRFVMHPATWAKLKAQVDAMNEKHEAKWS